MIYPKFFIFIIIFNIVSNNCFNFYSIFETNIAFNKFSNFFAIIGFFSIIVGSFAASIQYNLKRLIMFSSVANAGYVMVSLSTGYAYNYSCIIYIVMYFFSINFFFIVFNSIFNRIKSSNNNI